MKHARELIDELARSPGGPVFSRWYFMCSLLIPVSVVALLAVNYVETVKAIEHLTRDLCGSMRVQSSGYCVAFFSVRDTFVRYYIFDRVNGLTHEIMLFGFFVSFLNFVVQFASPFFFKVNFVNFKKNMLHAERVMHLKFTTILVLGFLLFFIGWLAVSFGASLPHDPSSLRLSQRGSSMGQYFFYAFLGQYLAGYFLSILIVSVRARSESNSSGGS